MKYLYRALLAATLSTTVAAGAFATTSTVNPNVPAQNAPLSSSPIRSNFAAVKADIDALWAAIAGGGITSLTGDVVASGSGSANAALQNTATARANIGLGVSSAPTFNGLTLSKNASALPTTQTGTVLQVGNANGATSRVEVDAFGADPHFSTVRWNGTAAAPTAIQSADTIGSVNFWGYNGTAVVGPQAALRCFANQTWSAGSNGSYCDLAVTPNGSNTLTQAIVINADGGITMPSVAGGSRGSGSINATSLCIGGDCNVVLTDVSQTFTKAQKVTPNTPALSTSTFTADFSTSNYFDFALTSACPCAIANPTNAVAGQSGVIEIDQDGTGSRTVTWGSAFKFAAATAPTLSTGASKGDYFGYYVKDSTHIIIGAGVLDAR